MNSLTKRQTILSGETFLEFVLGFPMIPHSHGFNTDLYTE